MDRAGEFIQLYNRLSDHLVTLVDAESYLTYAQLLRRAAHSSTAVASYESDLRDYGDLRNAIIHYKNYPREVLAEPTEPTLAAFRAIVDRVIAPKRLIPTFQQTVSSASSPASTLSWSRKMANPPSGRSASSPPGTCSKRHSSRGPDTATVAERLPD